jgi:c-di-GMP-related signal transduction protein
MILLIISALGTILYNYSLDAVNQQKSILESDIKTALDEAQVRIKVISTYSNYSANILNLTILNYGDYSVTIDDVYINNTNVQTYLDGQGTTILSLDLGKISFVSPIPIIQDALYDIVIVSLRGVTHTYRSKM